jgi:hypothetical protein
MFKSNSLLVLMVSILVLAACSSNEIGESKDVAQEKIYQQYSISYTEGNANAEVFCQFRFAGENGTTLVLNHPSQLQFDGEKLAVDSSTGSGAYYKATKPIANFYGNHLLIFSTTDEKKLENSFSFDRFKLVNLPATVSKQQPFNVHFETAALQPGDHIELTTHDTDSSFSISHTGAAGTAIVIPAAELKRQKEKDLTLEATLYRKLPLQKSTGEGGEIVIRYTLQPVKIKLAN